MFHGVSGVSIAALCPSTGNGDATVATQTAGLADSAGTPLFDSTLLQIASLSKPIAATFAVEYFAEAGISLEASVNDALAAAGSPLRLRAAAGMPAEWAETVTLRQTMDHTGLGMHYVNGVPRDEPFPPVLELLSGTDEAPAPYDYASLAVMKQPGSRFGYSGGGFLILQHLLECREAQPAISTHTGQCRLAGRVVNDILACGEQKRKHARELAGYHWPWARAP
ncbi:hypothetical protein EMIHUDRAFT_235110 [Emiliania huxleyi CCMP1516]|uniref:Beta-lactamase-related domain-containing protein n=2 Tax=Emiliania huxleyi TaxID=2903 RepID=A0A0D3JXD0_EMIH1|nr:hypothetical protein EMIHUDRAFT_235110 [Emiliania huxleyi CCMP1516]EOD28165.1 hypothetical protein EMIHUDRAFT_235110 [Emiliania huxleyi CCMP1516]|eukprot:XP_005780594.1 hypothetical protein EMIHUDRAFT_235110 [Emiliania huxleyi CCMP1516]